MFSTLLQSTAFSLPIPDNVHERAELESQQYLPYLAKVEQVYLSSLAIYIAQYYLRLCGYPVPSPEEQSQNFVAQALSNTSSVSISGYGSVACMIVSSNTITIDIPAIADTAPVGYLAVEFDDDLEEATLLGFAPQTAQPTVRLNELQPLSELPGYLSQVNPLLSAAVQLNRWWGRSFESGWTLISELVEGGDADAAFAFRSARSLHSRSYRRSGRSANNVGDRDLSDTTSSEELLPEDGMICQKSLSLGADGGRFSLALMMERFSEAQEVNILVRLSPDLGQACLPANVYLIAADESRAVFSSIRSRENSPATELRFKADPGDYFSLEVTFNGVTVREAFVV